MLFVFLIAGKEAMKKGPGAFNLAASMEYKKLDGDRSWLNESSIESNYEMNEGAIKREGAKIFLKIQSQVCLDY